MFQSLIEGICIEYGQQFVNLIKRKQVANGKETEAEGGSCVLIF
jgi:hypothetical protein